MEFCWLLDPLQILLCVLCLRLCLYWLGISLKKGPEKDLKGKETKNHNTLTVSKNDIFSVSRTLTSGLRSRNSENFILNGFILWSRWRSTDKIWRLFRFDFVAALLTQVFEGSFCDRIEKFDEIYAKTIKSPIKFHRSYKFEVLRQGVVNQAKDSICQIGSGSSIVSGSSRTWHEL